MVLGFIHKTEIVSAFFAASSDKVKSSNFGKTKDTEKNKDTKKDDKTKDNQTDQNETQKGAGSRSWAGRPDTGKSTNRSDTGKSTYDSRK